MEAARIGRAGDAVAGEGVQRPGTLRIGLLILGIPQFMIGAWALASPHAWFDTFPGAGHHWLPDYGPFDSHLAFDVGATFVAIGLVLILAAVWLERRVVQLALVGYLAYAIPHTIYHLANDHDLGGSDQVVNGATLVLSVILALTLLWLTRRDPGDGAPSAPSAPSGGGSRLAPPPGGPVTFFGRFYARRKYGGDVRPVDAFAHCRGIATGYGAFELAAERSSRVPRRLKMLGELRTSSVVGCEWCMDFGSHLARAQAGFSERELRELARYRESDAFSELDKLVLEYATAISRTPAEVDESLFERLRAELDDAQIVELTTLIALENFRARFNQAVGIEPQGFSEGAVCVIPDRLAAAA